MQAVQDFTVSHLRPRKSVEGKKSLCQSKSAVTNNDSVGSFSEMKIESTESFPRQLSGSWNADETQNSCYCLEDDPEELPGSFKRLGESEQYGVELCLKSAETNEEQYCSTEDHSAIYNLNSADVFSKRGKNKFQKAAIPGDFSATPFSIGSAELSSSSTSEEFLSSEDEYWSCKEDDTYMNYEKAPPRRYGKFPPPLTTYTRYINASNPPVAMPRVFLQSIKQNGRFVLKEMDARPQALLKAKREDGRLQFYLVRPIHDCDSPYSTSSDEQEEAESTNGILNDPIGQEDPDAQWATDSIPTEEKRGFQTEDVKIPPAEQQLEEDTKFRKEEIELKSKIRSWEDDEKHFGDLMTEIDSCSELTNSRERHAIAPCMDSNTEDSTKSKQHNNRLLMGCDGNRCFWAPTQSFLHKSLIRMRPVVS